jgi:hypothetical protein
MTTRFSSDWMADTSLRARLVASLLAGWTIAASRTVRQKRLDVLFMQVLADIMPDEALFIDYLLDVRGRRMAAVKKLHAYRWARCTAEERCSLRGNVGHCVPASSRAFRPDGATGFLLQRW